MNNFGLYDLYCYFNDGFIDKFCSILYILSNVAINVCEYVTLLSLIVISDERINKLKKISICCMVGYSFLSLITNCLLLFDIISADIYNNIFSLKLENAISNISEFAKYFVIILYLIFKNNNDLVSKENVNLNNQISKETNNNQLLDDGSNLHLENNNQINNNINLVQSESELNSIISDNETLNKETIDEKIDIL